MSSIIHLSDLHFGAADPGAMEGLLATINSANANAIVITGDLTQAGRKAEFRQAQAFLERLAAPALIVPGNHDVPVYDLGQRFLSPWRRFQQHIHPELCPALMIDGVYMLGLNSARRAGASLDWSLGRLSCDQLDFAQRSLLNANEATLKIVAFHHPITPGPGRAGRAVISQPERAIMSFARAGADLILTGHAHIAQTTILQAEDKNLLAAAAGTAMSTRLRGEGASFNYLNWNHQELEVAVHRYKDGDFPKENVRRYSRTASGWREMAS